MTDKELKKLRRDDLLQILIDQQRRIDELTQALETREKALEDRSIALEECGSVAEAALKLNDVFDRAQRAADQYVEETHRRENALRETAEALVTDARTRATEIVAEAQREAERLVAEARRAAEEIAGAEIPPESASTPDGAQAQDKRQGLFRRNRE